MKLFLLITNKEEKFEVNHRAFCCYNDAKAYSKNYKKDDFEIKEIYLGDYTYCDYSLSQLPLGGCDKQGLDNAISYTIEHLRKLQDMIDYDNPKESIFEAIFYIEGRLKTLKSFLESNALKDVAEDVLNEKNLLDFMKE